MSLNIVIPMGGNGKRFADVGYKEPKPFIKVDGKPMLLRVLENVGPIMGKYIFIANAEQMIEWGEVLHTDVISKIPEVLSDCEIILEHERKGAAPGVLLAKPFIDNNDVLIVMNSDQLVGGSNIGEASLYFLNSGADVGVLCFLSREMKWSYASVNDGGLITRIAEKQVISDFATCGIYWFRNGRTFVSCAEEMIEKNDRVNGEFYVAPSINYAILRGMKVMPYMVNEMHGLGTPEDLKKYEART
jgi:dTDP-glucose pyrophosphorylase